MASERDDDHIDRKELLDSSVGFGTFSPRDTLLPASAAFSTGSASSYKPCPRDPPHLSKKPCPRTQPRVSTKTCPRDIARSFSIQNTSCPRHPVTPSSQPQYNPCPRDFAASKYKSGPS
eukprot:3543423-Rhodomonas_salina.3